MPFINSGFWVLLNNPFTVLTETNSIEVHFTCSIDYTRLAHFAKTNCFAKLSFDSIHSEIIRFNGRDERNIRTATSNVNSPIFRKKAL